MQEHRRSNRTNPANQCCYHTRRSRNRIMIAALLSARLKRSNPCPLFMFNFWSSYVASVQRLSQNGSNWLNNSTIAVAVWKTGLGENRTKDSTVSLNVTFELYIV